MLRLPLTALALALFASPGFAAPAAVATVLGEPVICAPAQGDDPCPNLRGAIIGPLLQDFAKRQRITVSAGEIAGVEKALRLSPPPASASKEEKAAFEQIPRGVVQQWKVSKALYERYGGDVIFQQGNPTEPVGALHRFLLEQEKAGAFSIADTRYRQQFYAYFERTPHTVIPPSKVDFTHPWWLQKPAD